jgi:hypothetical protein
MGDEPYPDTTTASTRQARIARLIQAALEGFYVHPQPNDEQYAQADDHDHEFYLQHLLDQAQTPNQQEQARQMAQYRRETYDTFKDPPTEKAIQERNKKRYKVLQNPAVEKKIRAWWDQSHLKDIPLRFVAGNMRQISPVGKPGAITFFYDPNGAEDMPTAWIVTHNLAHALWERGEPINEVDKLRETYNPKHYPYDERAKNRVPKQFLFGNTLDQEDENPRPVPDVKSMRLNKLLPGYEPFYEAFTKWVQSGNVRLLPDNPTNQAKSQALTQYFKESLMKLAQNGHVVYAIGRNV